MCPVLDVHGSVVLIVRGDKLLMWGSPYLGTLFRIYADVLVWMYGALWFFLQPNISPLALSSDCIGVT